MSSTVAAKLAVFQHAKMIETFSKTYAAFRPPDGGVVGVDFTARDVTPMHNGGKQKSWSSSAVTKDVMEKRFSRLRVPVDPAAEHLRMARKAAAAAADAAEREAKAAEREAVLSGEAKPKRRPRRPRSARPSSSRPGGRQRHVTDQAGGSGRASRDSAGRPVSAPVSRGPSSADASGSGSDGGGARRARVRVPPASPMTTSSATAAASAGHEAGASAAGGGEGTFMTDVPGQSPVRDAAGNGSSGSTAAGAPSGLSVAAPAAAAPSEPPKPTTDGATIAKRRAELAKPSAAAMAAAAAASQSGSAASAAAAASTGAKLPAGVLPAGAAASILSLNVSSIPGVSQGPGTAAAAAAEKLVLSKALAATDGPGGSAGVDTDKPLPPNAPIHVRVRYRVEAARQEPAELARRVRQYQREQRMQMGGGENGEGRNVVSEYVALADAGYNTPRAVEERKVAARETHAARQDAAADLQRRQAEERAERSYRLEMPLDPDQDPEVLAARAAAKHKRRVALFLEMVHLGSRVHHMTEKGSKALDDARAARARATGASTFQRAWRHRHFVRETNRRMHANTVLRHMVRARLFRNRLLRSHPQKDAADRVHHFLVSIRTSLFRKVMKNFMFRVTFAQRLYRDYMVCTEARLYVLGMRWDALVAERVARERAALRRERKKQRLAAQAAEAVGESKARALLGLDGPPNRHGHVGSPSSSPQSSRVHLGTQGSMRGGFGESSRVSLAGGGDSSTGGGGAFRRARTFHAPRGKVTGWGLVGGAVRDEDASTPGGIRRGTSFHPGMSGGHLALIGHTGGHMGGLATTLADVARQRRREERMSEWDVLTIPEGAAFAQKLKKRVLKRALFDARAHFKAHAIPQQATSKLQSVANRLRVDVKDAMALLRANNKGVRTMLERRYFEASLGKTRIARFNMYTKFDEAGMRDLLDMHWAELAAGLQHVKAQTDERRGTLADALRARIRAKITAEQTSTPRTPAREPASPGAIPLSLANKLGSLTGKSKSLGGGAMPVPSPLRTPAAEGGSMYGGGGSPAGSRAALAAMPSFGAGHDPFGEVVVPSSPHTLSSSERSPKHVRMSSITEEIGTDAAPPPAPPTEGSTALPQAGDGSKRRSGRGGRTNAPSKTPAPPAKPATPRTGGRRGKRA